MDAQATARIPRVFEAMPDPRRHNIHHKLFDIITIAMFAVVCGCDDWCAVAEYGRTKFDWLKTFLELPNGIPSHDTFNDVFARLNPDAFEACFRNWMAAMVEVSGGKLVAIDGKSIRRSFEHAWDKSGMAHLVSAFVAANKMVFAQEKTDGKGKELSAIEKLLDLLDLKGAVVTIDAIGCQRKIARKIRDAEAHYILQVKANQSHLQKMIARAIDEARLEGFKGRCSDSDHQTDGDHGRIETRTVHVIWDTSILGSIATRWPGLKSIIAVHRTRELNGHTSSQWHYYISSLDARRNAKQIADYIRSHWSIENNLHWQLDVSFNEDQRRIRTGYGDENFSRLCRMALNLLKRETSVKVGVATKRKKCGWDNDYLLKVVTA
ncbi:MAG TPA: ISAs1 family transposase [Tepidisphaeraceae bacterium]|nr:ISAs1 family transposase [Tepidisphaeraceae bacterium]